MARNPWGFGLFDPIWIDPYYQPKRASRQAPWRTTITEPYASRTDSTGAPLPDSIDEERVRRLIREEIANLPIRFDVPDVPPEA